MRLQLQRSLLRSWRLQRMTIRYVRRFRWTWTFTLDQKSSQMMETFYSYDSSTYCHTKIFCCLALVLCDNLLLLVVRSLCYSSQEIMKTFYTFANSQHRKSSFRVTMNRKLSHLDEAGHFLEKAGLSQQGLEKTLTYPNVVIKLHFPTPHRLLQTWGKFRFIWVLLLFFKSSPLSVFILISFLVDGHQRELPDHVGHYLQSLTPPASCDTYQDRLEQDLELQDRQRDAECLKTAKITVRSPLPAPSPSIPIQKNVAWLDSCIVFVQTIRENGGKERFGLTDVTWHIGWLFWFYTDTLLYTEFVIVFGKIYLEETLRVIGHRVDTCLHKHPYEIKYHVCSKYCISETTPFCLENLLEFAIMVKTNSFLGEFLSAFTEEVSYYGWNEQLPTPHPSCPHHHPKKRSFVFIDWYIWHKQPPLSATQCSCSLILVLPPHPLSCVCALQLAALLATFWLDIVWTLTQCREFCDHLTSLINKSSVAKVICIMSNLQ